MALSENIPDRPDERKAQRWNTPALTHLVRSEPLGQQLSPGALNHARIIAEREAETHKLRLAAQAEVLDRIDPLSQAPDGQLIARYGEAAIIANRALPWRRIGGTTIVLIQSGDRFERLEPALRALFGPVRAAPINRERMDEALRRYCAGTLTLLAEERTDPDLSCRTWATGRVARVGAAALVALVGAFLLWPGPVTAALAAWGILCMALGTALKIAAAVLSGRSERAGRPAAAPQLLQLPVVTILVPLFREKDIAAHLINRLQRLDYPRDKLDICLVVEASDATTRATLEQTTLPSYMRALTVPQGILQTKPRALNYALTFARGTIIGVYDAEDAPEPGQLRRVVTRFAERPRDVACLQGRLDFYNATSNWLARCFTIEYATWFRVVLPGLERLGLILPLGGTTLFFRRDVLEELGGWDAHNVTEDADLGIRLARAGYRTEMIETVTEEEANCRAWPWVRQRSRWLKGYAITYGVHMRRPRQLWREVGAWRFFGIQLLFLGTLSQFVLMPVLWSFWLIALGLPHPLSGAIPQPVALAMMGLFLFAELAGIVIAAIAVRRAGKPGLALWAPTLHVYFPLAALAAYRGLWEIATRPFYWDKTAHGVFAPTAPLRGQRIRRPLPPFRHPAAGE